MTILSGVFLLSAGFCIVMIGILSSLRASGEPGVKEWMAANTIAAVAFVLYAFGRQLPPLIAYEAANAAYAMAGMMVWAGFRRFFLQQVPFRALCAGLAGFTAVVAFFHYVHDSFALRTIAVSLCQVTLLSMIVATIFQSRKQWQTRYPYLFTATVAALLAVGNTVRGVVHLVHSAEVTSLLQPSLWSIFFLSAGTVVLPILTFGAMMMVHDRMVRHARHVGSRDFLTGAFTRTVFLKTLEQAMQRSGAMTHDTALLLFSVKNLPALRKAGGDAVADQVLVDVALQAERVIKLPRWFARIGVEEFAVLLPQTSHDAALSFAQRLLAGLVSSGILGRFASIDGLPSGAIGMGLAVSLEDDTVYDLLARAECALAAAGDAPASRIVSAETEADDVSL